ncbi:MAG: hypothetical protein R3290_11480, partial [Acidimicrobiia bacterium]|nr:hypothetical protein [Acidimicrobiia bacterium]
MRLTSATPDAGWYVEVEASGPPQVEVTFEADEDRETEVRVSVVGGELRIEVRDDPGLVASYHVQLGGQDPADSDQGRFVGIERDPRLRRKGGRQCEKLAGDVEVSVTDRSAGKGFLDPPAGLFEGLFVAPDLAD